MKLDVVLFSEEQKPIFDWFRSAHLQAVELVIISNLSSTIALLHRLLSITSIDEGEIYFWTLI
jgi:hypothetical protein